MAGMGESCSHVASLLWAIEAGVRMRDSMTVTQKKAYWVLPPSVKEIPYAPLSYINFHGKSQSTSSSVSLSANPLNQPCTTSNLTSKTIECPSSEEMDHLFASLSTCSTKPAILSLVRNYCSNYIPNSLAPDMPMTFSDLFKPEYLSAGFADLLQIPVDVEIEVTPEQSRAVEEKTRGQAHCRLWYRMRTGRITASRLKAVCSTDPSMPSNSLITSICHPELFKFRTAATTWGCDHESMARAKYKALYSLLHQNFAVSECGFFINCDHPFMGASPDALVSCLCCGEGICEIKVSYTSLLPSLCTYMYLYAYSVHTAIIMSLLRMLLIARTSV